ncbi:PEP-CTERM sorting domain-containing protein [Arsukibacterium sp.]|uniref:PEP-CTERM sorting domain-containing protein n=1 Tax=Arsukibacterium sp. TaxID=1977258 RepID=UPI002FD9C959
MIKNTFLPMMSGIVLLVMSVAVKATPITIDVRYQNMVNGSETISASLNDTSSRSVLAGMIRFSYDNLSSPLPFELDDDLTTFCIEFSQLIKTNQTLTYQIQSADELFGAAKADAITRLYSGFRDQTGTSIGNAAFQLALWEIVHDFQSDLSGFLLERGSFKTTSSNQSVTLAQSWLDQLANIKSQHTMHVMTNSQSQNQLIFSGQPQTSFNDPVPVSAPATLGIFGLGLLALGLRRRQA